MKHRLAGVTLVELLVIIGVIAVVCLLAFPLFGHLARRGQTVSCLANMRQLSSILINYTLDNPRRKGYLPYAYDSSGSGPTVTWAIRLQEAGLLPDSATEMSTRSQTSLLFCPGSDVRWLGRFDWLRGHYGLNTNLSGALSGFPAVPLRSLERPSRVIMLMDAGAYSLAWSHVSNPLMAIWYLPGATRNTNVSWDQSNRNDALRGRHGGRLNVAFADGHIESLTADQISGDSAYWFPNQP